jgi:hypothetical protein
MDAVGYTPDDGYAGTFNEDEDGEWEWDGDMVAQRPDSQ